MPNPDASREAAHRRYEAAQEISQNNPDVSLDEALAQKTWNVDWQPGDPTYQEVQENWDYYSQLTNGGQVPISEAARQQRNAGNQGITSTRSYYTDQQQSAQQKDRQREAVKPTELPSYVETVSGRTIPVNQPSANSSANVSISDVRMSPSERAERDESERDEQRLQQQSESLQPSVQTSGSQKSLQELQDDLDKWQQDWNRRTDNTSFEDWQRENRPYDEPLVLPDQSEIQRRFFNVEDGSLRSPVDWNLLGFTSQQQTPEAARNLYEYQFAQDDRTLGPRAPRTWTPSNVVRRDAIDDGVSPASRDALYMTGDQYMKYRELGLPGRDLDQINPNEIYNKQDEMEDYGFIPYLPDQESVDRFHDAAVAPAVSNLFNDLANARRDMTDYTINYDGQQYSGKDFDKNIRLWNQRTSDNAKIVYDQSEATEDAVPQALIATDENGKEYVAPGRPVREVQQDGTIRWKFNDNPDDDWVFADEKDEDRSTSHRPAADGEYVAAWKNQEPLVLDDGRKIRADKAVDIWKNYDNYVDYGPLDIARPSVEDPVKEGGWAPWFVDMALSSAPYFYFPTSGLKAVGDAMNNYEGFQPGYQDQYSNTYSLLSENPTEEQRAYSTIGSAVMPVTEQLWGPLGSFGGKTLLGNPAKAIASRIPGSERIIEHPVSRWAQGAVNEGLEEIPGNWVEEFQQNGLGGWYANDKLQFDDQGNPVMDYKGEEQLPVIDSQGRVLKEATSPGVRIGNMMGDVPLAMLGGAALGGGLGVAEVPSYYRQYQLNQDQRNRFGDVATPVDVDVDALFSSQALNDAERNYYNR